MLKFKDIILPFLLVWCLSACTESEAWLNPVMMGGGVTGGVSAEWSDGYESGDFTGWNQGETDTGGLFSVQSSVKRTGTYAAQFDLDATTAAYAKHNLVSDLTEGYVIFYIRFSDVTAVDTATGQFRTFLAQDSNANGSFWFGFFTEANSPYDLLRINGVYYVDDGSYPGTPTFAGYQNIAPAIDTWYPVQIHFKISSGANDGIYKVWFNELLKINITNIDNDEQIGFSRLFGGNNFVEWRTDAGIDIFYDDFAVYSGAP